MTLRSYEVNNIYDRAWAHMGAPPFGKLSRTNDWSAYAHSRDSRACRVHDAGCGAADGPAYSAATSAGDWPCISMQGTPPP
jgi:hypothetical protein